MAIIELISELGVSLLAGGAAGLTALIGLFKWYFDRKDRLKKEKLQKEKEQQDKTSSRMPAMFEAFNELYSTMLEPVTDHGAIRTLLLNASDSGRIPRIGIPLFVTVVAEVVNPYHKSVRESWTARPVDDQYIQMLIDLTARGQTEVIVSELKEGDPMRDTSVVAKTIESDIRLICQCDREMYYLAFHFDKNIPETAEYREEIRSLVLRVKEILEKEILEQKEVIELTKEGE